MENNINTDLSKFSETEAKLADLKTQAENFKVVGVDDMAGYSEVKSFRNQVLVKLRVAMDEERKNKKKYFLDASKYIESVAQKIITEIERIEAICKSKEAIIDDYQAQIKAQKEKERKEKLDKRVAELTAVKATFDINLIEILAEENYQSFLKEATDKFEKEQAEQKRIADELELLRKEKAEREAILLKEKEEKDKITREEKARADAEILKLRRELEAKEKKEREEREKEKRREQELKKATKDKKLLNYVQFKFTTLEVAQAEIIRLIELGGFYPSEIE